ncbi:MAG: c-type cytochrome [Lentimicrobiaceae bacterium]|nr:c-type cytochrome [Lentimicrobiaceae bacterium]MCB9024270.1 c-type cytochrome [Lentimicrobiaceae bacterium]MCO5265268.1 c-type cytochrome [Lentimicrobium sp.]
MKNPVKLIAIFTTAIFMLTINLAMIQKPGSPWVIPAKYKSMKSTIKAGDASINTTGKELYNKNCKSCHGAKGLGDGPKAASLKTSTGDFSTKAFQDQTDGEIYYQSIIGRDEMPNFEKKITDESDRWAVVYYMRTMKK